MSNYEMWDYLSAVSADSTYTLTVAPSGMAETIQKTGSIREGDDGSEERVCFSNTPIFHQTLSFTALSTQDAGEVYNAYCSSNIGNGPYRSFRWDHANPGDTHLYTVRFDGQLPRNLTMPELYNYGSVTLKILGRAT